MTDKTDLIREIHEYVTTHGGENTATHLLVQAASAIQTQAAELEAVGAGGVQALSAAPAGWKLVPENATDAMVFAGCTVDNATHTKIENSILKAKVWEAMLEAAPKAAPGELHDHQILAITTAYEQGVGKGRQAHESGKEIANPYGTGYRCDLAWQYGYEEGKEQAEAMLAASPTPPAEKQAAPKAAPVVWLSSKQLRGVTTLHGQYLPFRCQPEGRFDTPVYLVEAAPKTAPQQEAQEPVAWYEYNADLDAWFLAYRRNPKAKTRPLVFGDTAPQTAPAPLSDDAKDAARWRWLSEHIGAAWNEGKFTSLVRIVSDKNRAALNASIDRMMTGDWSDAALAAQERQP